MQEQLFGHRSAAQRQSSTNNHGHTASAVQWFTAESHSMQPMSDRHNLNILRGSSLVIPTLIRSWSMHHGPGQHESEGRHEGKLRLMTVLPC